MNKLIIGVLCLTSVYSHAAENEDYSCKATVVNYAIKNGSMRVSTVASKELKRDGRHSSISLSSFIFSVTEPDGRNPSVIKLSIYDRRSANLLLVSDVVTSRPTAEIETSVTADIDKGLIRVSLECATINR